MRRLNSNNERGAVLAITAAAMIVFVGLAALAIDLGIGWSARRNLVTTTDAAALAAGGTYASGGTGCDAVAAAYVADNNANATMTGCFFNGTSSGGTVIVDAEEVIDTFFGRALGIDQFNAISSSTVQWGSARSATGLRPFGLCSESPEIAAFLTNPLMTQTHKIMYTKDDPDRCGSDAPGNWGVIDFNGGNNGTPEVVEWVKNGYPDEVFAGTSTGNCTNEAFACYDLNPGAQTALKNEVATLKANGTVITLPIYNLIKGAGGNPAAELHIMGFARVTVIDFKFTGQQAQWYMTLKFEAGVITGGCCSPGGTQTNVSTMAICDVDRKNLGSC